MKHSESMMCHVLIVAFVLAVLVVTIMIVLEKLGIIILGDGLFQTRLGPRFKKGARTDQSKGKR